MYTDFPLWLVVAYKSKFKHKQNAEEIPNNPHSLTKKPPNIVHQ